MKLKRKLVKLTTWILKQERSTRIGMKMIRSTTKLLRKCRVFTRSLIRIRNKTPDNGHERYPETDLSDLSQSYCSQQ